MCFVSNQFVIDRTISWSIVHDLTSTTKNCFNCYIFFSHSTCLYIKLTEFCLHPLPALICLSYRKESSPINALEGELICLREISIKVYKLFMLLLFVYLFMFVFVEFNSLSLFYIDFVVIFLFIRWSCKQVHCVCFRNFFLSF